MKSEDLLNKLNFLNWLVALVTDTEPRGGFSSKIGYLKKIPRLCLTHEAHMIIT